MESDKVFAVTVMLGVIAVCITLAVIVLALINHANEAGTRGSITHRQKIEACKTIETEWLRAVCINNGIGSYGG